MNIGAIVLYKNRPAVITNIVNGKFEIETESGIKKVREKDFCLLSNDNKQNLQTILNAECDEVDFSEAADFFENASASFSEIQELMWKELRPEQIWAVWQRIYTSPLIIAESPDKPIKFRTENEFNLLQKKQTDKQSEKKDYDDFIMLLSKCIKINDFTQFDLKKYSRFLQEIEAVALEKTDKTRILKDLHLKEQCETAHKILIQTGYWKFEKNPYPTRLGHPLNSPKIELPPLNLTKEYFDLTDITSFAIDNQNSTDADDAICFDGAYLWIHIANPADTITPDSDSDLNARKRGATLYLPEGISRMLGEQTVKKFALGLNDISYALSFKIKLKSDAEIEEVTILRTKIKVKCITYSEAEKQKETEQLKPFFEIAKLNRKKRENAGAISINFPEADITVNSVEGAQKVFITPHNRSEAFLMIKEMMLLAGEAAARFAFKNNIPFQFISQESPALPKHIPEGLAGEYKKRKAMKPRTVSTTPSMHAALGIAMYSQITSPLRRYGDLVAHQQLLKFIDGEQLLKTEEFLRRIDTGDRAARNCVYIERLSKQHWTLIYLLQNTDWKGEAIILDSIKSSAKIFIPSICFETDIVLTKQLSINEKITVKASNIDIPNLKVTFIETDE